MDMHTRHSPVRLSKSIFGGKLLIAMVDQGLISGSNFVLSIILARWMTIPEYGSYSLAFALFLLVSLVYQTMLIEPMGVFGPSTYADQLRDYIGAVFTMQLGLVFATAVVLGGIAVVSYTLSLSTTLHWALLSVLVTTPTVLFFAVIRRAVYLELAPTRAILGAIIYCLFLFGSVLLLKTANEISAFRAFLAMGIAAAIAGAVLAVRFHPGRRLMTIHALKAIVRDHWWFGKWELAASVLGWVPWNIYYVVISRFGGLEETGTLKALLNFALPVLQMFLGITLLVQPYVSRVCDQEGAIRARSLARHITAFSAGCAVSYWIVVAIFRHDVVRLLYSGRYGNTTQWLPLVAVASVFWSAMFGPLIALRAIRSPSSIFFAYAAASLVSVVVGIPATWAFGITGAVGTIVLSSFSATAFCFVQLERKLTYMLPAVVIRVAPETTV